MGRKMLALNVAHGTRCNSGLSACHVLVQPSLMSGKVFLSVSASCGAYSLDKCKGKCLRFYDKLACSSHARRRCLAVTVFCLAVAFDHFAFMMPCLCPRVFVLCAPIMYVSSKVCQAPAMPQACFAAEWPLQAIRMGPPPAAISEPKGWRPRLHWQITPLHHKCSTLALI